MLRTLRSAVVIGVFCFTAGQAWAVERIDREEREPLVDDWRRDALQNMRVAPAPQLISDPVELAAYRAAGFNTLVVFDVTGYNESGTSWKFKSEEQVRAETEFARENHMPLVLGMAVESYVAAVTKTPVEFAKKTKAIVPNGVIPRAGDDEIRERVQLWKEYGDDVLVGVFPWYDDVFWQNVDVDRQRHVYGLIKDVAPDWYVFGMIGEFGFYASDDAIARYYDPRAFDHLIVLMYPFNVGQALTEFPLDNLASSDPDGDTTRYVDRFIARMDERFFKQLRTRQLILIVVQAFYYRDEPTGHIPRAKDLEIMIRRSNEQLRKLPGQKMNRSAAYFSWGTAGSDPVGMADRPDWRDAARDVNHDFDREGVHRFQR